MERLSWWPAVLGVALAMIVVVLVKPVQSSLSYASAVVVLIALLGWVLEARAVAGPPPVAEPEHEEEHAPRPTYSPRPRAARGAGRCPRRGRHPAARDGACGDRGRRGAGRPADARRRPHADASAGAGGRGAGRGGRRHRRGALGAAGDIAARALARHVLGGAGG